MIQEHRACEQEEAGGCRETAHQAALAFINSNIHMDVPPQGERGPGHPLLASPIGCGPEFRPSACGCDPLI